MLLIGMNAQRTISVLPEMAEVVLSGDIVRAIQLGSAYLEQPSILRPPRESATVSQLLARCLLAAGHEEDAEDLLRSACRQYQQVSRGHVRWLSGLDQGAMQLHLNRPGRAAEAFCDIADDPAADSDLRIEAMAGAATALHRLGECGRGRRSLAAAKQLCLVNGDIARLELVNCVGLELAALQYGRRFEALGDHAMCSVYRTDAAHLPPLDELQREIREVAQRMKVTAPLIARRLDSLARSLVPSVASVHMQEMLSWIRSRKLVGLETALRVESAMLMMAFGAGASVAEIIAPQINDETQLQRSRHALDLHYLMSKLSQMNGRLDDALRWYSSHSRHAVAVLQSGQERRKADGFMHAPQDAAHPAEDTARARLPLRYRRAYQFILDNLQEETLSVQRVASELGVTERALQMAFRTYLGLTPAEVIRTRRVERVREELTKKAGDTDLMELASRFGIRNRSTLSSNYRTRFLETPMQTLRGGVPAQLPAGRLSVE